MLKFNSHVIQLLNWHVCCKVKQEFKYPESLLKKFLLYYQSFSYFLYSMGYKSLKKEPQWMCMPKTLAICYIGLMITNPSILPCDVIRYCIRIIILFFPYVRVLITNLIRTGCRHLAVSYSLNCHNRKLSHNVYIIVIVWHQNSCLCPPQLYYHINGMGCQKMNNLQYWLEHSLLHLIVKLVYTW